MLYLCIVNEQEIMKHLSSCFEALQKESYSIYLFSLFPHSLLMLTCQLVTAVDPHHPEDKSHVCLRALTTGIYGFQQMASDISHATSLTEADALAAMKAFVTFTRNALVNGRNVELEGLGLLRLCIGSRMTPAAVAGRKNFRLHSIIKDIRVAFLPSPSLKAFVKDNTKVVLKKGGLPLTPP